MIPRYGNAGYLASLNRKVLQSACHQAHALHLQPVGATRGFPAEIDRPRPTRPARQKAAPSTRLRRQPGAPRRQASFAARR